MIGTHNVDRRSNDDILDAYGWGYENPHYKKVFLFCLVKTAQVETVCKLPYLQIRASIAAFLKYIKANPLTNALKYSQQTMDDRSKRRWF